MTASEIVEPPAIVTPVKRLPFAPSTESAVLPVPYWALAEVIEAVPPST